MSARCSANQIADFAVLLGLTGSFPKCCKYVEQVLELKNLDLIISTLDVFATAFRSSFEDIYRKYEVDIPLPHEKFVEFLRPRCLLLTKDDKCFNFMLVCAFVSEMINSFAHYNRCYHLVEVSSRCLATILKNRFKRIFETHSGWEELRSFCIKIHTMVYPPGKKCKSDCNQSVEKVDKSTTQDYYEKERGYSFHVTNKMDAAFSNSTQKFAESSAEKDKADENNEDSNTKMAYLTIEKEGEKLEPLCKFEFHTSVGAMHIFRLKYKEKDVHENTERKGDEKDWATDALLSDLAKEFTNMVVNTPVISNEKEGTKKHGQKNLRVPFGKRIETNLTERIEYLCTSGLASTSAPHSFTLKDEDSLPKEAADKEKTYSEKNAKQDDEKVCAIGDKDTEKFGKITGLKQNVTLPIGDCLAIKQATEKLDDLCTSGLVSTSAPHSFTLKDEDYLPKEAADEEKIYNEKNARQNNDVCKTNTKDSSSPNSKQEGVKTGIYKNDEATEKLDQMFSFKNRLTLSFETGLATKKTREKLNLCNFEPSLSVLHTLQLKGVDFSPKEKSTDKEKTNDEMNARADNKKLCPTGAEDSYKKDERPEKRGMCSAQKRLMRIKTRNQNKHEKFFQMFGFKKRLTLPFRNDLVQHLITIKPTSSAGALDALHVKGEDAPTNEESIDREKIVDESNTTDYLTDSLLSDLTYELNKIAVKYAIYDNVEGVEKSSYRMNFIKKMTLPLQKDSAVEKSIENPLDLSKSGTGSSVNALQFGDGESCSKDESEDNEQFDIHSMPADEIRSRITYNAQHLSEIMDLIKKCEKDIDPNLFPPDEYNILSDEKLEARGGISENQSRQPNQPKIIVKTIVFAQNIKKGQAIKRIFRENNPSNEFSDDVAFEYDQQMLASEDTPCPLCVGKMTTFFIVWMENLIKKYPNNFHVSNLFNVTGFRIEQENTLGEKQIIEYVNPEEISDFSRATFEFGWTEIPSYTEITNFK